MRALCGAIISAGALIGLGLFSIGVGTRYSSYPRLEAEGSNFQWVLLRNMDTSLLITLVLLVGALVIGLGIAFLGLAYHHHHRAQELLHLHRHAQSTDRPPASERLTL